MGFILATFSVSTTTTMRGGISEISPLILSSSANMPFYQAMKPLANTVCPNYLESL
jgi:hypothetical protein